MNEPLRGWKTYAVGLTTIAYGVGVQGYLQNDWAAAGQTVLVGLAILAGRKAIQKAERPH